MGLILLSVLLYTGIATTRLRWLNIAVIGLLAMLGTAYQTSGKISSLRSLGEDASDLWDPLIFAGNVALNFAIACAFYFGGFAIGKLYRRRRRKDR